MAVVVCLLSSQGVAEESSPAAGEATLVIGRALVRSPDGSEAELVRGMKIKPGDRVETYSNGHAHFRFIDDALLSVRPNSTLEVVEYLFDGDDPSKSAVKFNLQEGVARSISGEAAKAARDRFRLNTPVAAIGVRGTDFVVGADSSSTRALVNEGSIVISPFSASCFENALGPCAGDGLELAIEASQLAALRSGDSALRIPAIQNVRAPGFLQRQLQISSSSPPDNESLARASGSPEAGASSDQRSNEVLLEGVTSPVVRTNAQIAVNKVVQTDFIPEAVLSVTADGEIENFDYTPPRLLVLGSLEDRQLVWGRYRDSLLFSDRLALEFEEASSSRRITIGSTEYGLFRKDNESRRVASDLGLVGFQLSSAQAVFNSSTGIVLLQVNDGSLGIDFQSNSFETALNLHHEQLGQLGFSASGRLFDGGFFRAIESTQRIAGAVSYDGSEAGYFFEKQIGESTLSGLTLWDSK